MAANRAAHAADRIGVGSINIEESLGGWLALLRKVRTPRDRANAARLLTDAVVFLNQFELIPATEAAELRYDRLVKLKLNVGGNDLRLAALALELPATVVTDNARDFGRVPGLLWVDWTV